MIREGLEEARFELFDEELSAKWRPDQEALEQGRHFGRRYARALADVSVS